MERWMKNESSNLSIYPAGPILGTCVPTPEKHYCNQINFETLLQPMELSLAYHKHASFGGIHMRFDSVAPVHITLGVGGINYNI